MSPEESAPESAPGPAPEPLPATLVVEGLTRRYGDRVAVQGLGFSLAAGQVLGLVGPNGSGKTTTLRSIAGVLPIQEGRVVVAGHDVAREPVAARRRMAWIPDDPQPFEALTVLEHLEVVAGLWGVDPWRERADALLERFELGDRAGSLGGELSRGMRQKLAFAQAWLVAPDLLLLDEPLSGLDPRGIRVAREALRDLARAGTAVVLSSHLLELVEALADRVLVLGGGKKRFDGTIDEARSVAESVAARSGAVRAAGARAGLEEAFFALVDEEGAGATGGPEDAPSDPAGSRP